MAEQKIVRSIFADGKHILNENRWAVFLARRKKTDHGFLIIEGVENGKRKIIRADLFFQDGTQKSFGMSAKAIIIAKDIVIEKLSDLAGECFYQSYGVTKKQAQDLLANIEADKEKDIKYNRPGDGSTYSISNISQEFHNCLSWAEKKLQDIGLQTTNQWTDFLFKKPAAHIPGDDIEPDTTPNCSII